MATYPLKQISKRVLNLQQVPLRVLLDDCDTQKQKLVIKCNSSQMF
jgi:hypothetical protein